MSEREKMTQETAARDTASVENKTLHTIKIAAAELSFATNEAIKMLRANIQFSGYGKRAIAVTSCQPNEGKSFISFELARSLAELGERTLYLDCDIRNSIAQARLGVTEKLQGLSDFRVGKAQIGDILCKTDIPHLHLIFAGFLSPNPAELLSEELFERLCEVLKKNYDYIIMDTAPLGMVIDAAIIAKQCDGTIIVVKSGSTDRRLAQQVKGRLEAADAHILGVVLNEAGGGHGGYGYGGYGYGEYGYGERWEKSSKKTKKH